MVIEAMKGEVVKGITGAVISILAGFIGYLVAGNFVASSLEYKMATKEAYFSIPEQMKDGLQIRLQEKPISNVSVIDVAVFNRDRDLGVSTVYFKLTPKKDQLPQLISAEIVPPDNLPKVGIERVQTNDPTLIAFRFATIKRQGSSRYYLAKLIFEGDEAPLAQVLTNEKDVDIVPYREWRDWLVIGFSVVLAYTVLIAAALFWDSKHARKRREQLAKDFEALLMQQHLHGMAAVDCPQIRVADAAIAYKTFIEPKPGFFSKSKSSSTP